MSTKILLEIGGGWGRVRRMNKGLESMPYCARSQCFHLALKRYTFCSNLIEATWSEFSEVRTYTLQVCANVTLRWT